MVVGLLEERLDSESLNGGLELSVTGVVGAVELVQPNMISVYVDELYR